MSFRIHRRAVAEIDHEVDYYESREAGLGAELEDQIAAVFALILRFPIWLRRSGVTDRIDASWCSSASRSRFLTSSKVKTS